MDDVTGRAEFQRRSLSRLPQVVAAAWALAWAADRRLLLLGVGLKLITGVGIGFLLVFAHDLIGATLTTDTADAGIGAVVPQLVVMVLTGGLLAVVGAIASEAREVLALKTMRQVRQAIIDAARRVELAAYEVPAFHDRLLRAAASDYRPIQVVDGLVGAVGAAAAIIGVVGALLRVQPWLVLLVIGASAPLLVVVMRLGRALFRLHRQMAPEERLRSYLYDVLTHTSFAAEVRAFGLGDYFADRHAELFDRHLLALRSLARRRFRASVLTGLGMSLAIGAGIALLLVPAMSGRLSLDAILAAAVAMLVLGQRVAVVVSTIGVLYESAMFIEDFREFVTTATTPYAAVGSNPAPRNFGRITVDAVTFTYPGSVKPALHRVSIEIPAGQVVALVGENGSGKTTLAKLLCRLYEPASGTIRWDGQDIASVQPDELRRRIAVLFQDFGKYHLPARDNIGLGAVERIRDLDQIVTAAQRAGADEHLVTLPAGYETILSSQYDGGRDISVGQWQRVALARAFIRDAPLLILDEPTASLDPRAEHDLFTHMRRLYAGRTVLLISHRYNTVRDADYIYVLNAGRIAEHGSHQGLMASGGTYAELFALQATKYADQ